MPPISPCILIKDRKWAYGHLAKANELAAKWVLEESKNDALFVINGPSAYISSSWYAHRGGTDL